MKRKLSVLELELKKVSANKNSKNTYLDTLKKSPNVSSVKKMSWKIVKIITKDGEYIPSSDSEVLLVRIKKKNNSNKVKSKK